MIIKKYRLILANLITLIGMTIFISCGNGNQNKGITKIYNLTNPNKPYLKVQDLYHPQQLVDLGYKRSRKSSIWTKNNERFLIDINNNIKNEINYDSNILVTCAPQSDGFGDLALLYQTVKGIKNDFLLYIYIDYNEETNKIASAQKKFIEEKLSYLQNITILTKKQVEKLKFKNVITLPHRTLPEDFFRKIECENILGVTEYSMDDVYVHRNKFIKNRHIFRTGLDENSEGIFWVTPIEKEKLNSILTEQTDLLRKNINLFNTTRNPYLEGEDYVSWKNDLQCFVDKFSEGDYYFGYGCSSKSEELMTLFIKTVIRYEFLKHNNTIPQNHYDRNIIVVLPGKMNREKINNLRQEIGGLKIQIDNNKNILPVGSITLHNNFNINEMESMVNFCGSDNDKLQEFLNENNEKSEESNLDLGYNTGYHLHLITGYFKNNVFKGLMQKSKPFVMSTGDQSTTEALSFCKLVIYDGAEHKKYFADELCNLVVKKMNKFNHNSFYTNNNISKLFLRITCDNISFAGPCGIRDCVSSMAIDFLSLEIANLLLSFDYNTYQKIFPNIRRNFPCSERLLKKAKEVFSLNPNL